MHCAACDKFIENFDISNDLCAECYGIVISLLEGPQDEEEAMEMFESYDSDKL